MYARATFPLASLSASHSLPKWLLIERTGNSKPRSRAVNIRDSVYMPRSFKFSCEICSSICFCDHQITARGETLFCFFRDSEDFNVMSGSDGALLTSLKHYKCWDNTNWQTECSRFLFFFQGKDTFFFLLSFLLFFFLSLLFLYSCHLSQWPLAALWE